MIDNRTLEPTEKIIADTLSSFSENDIRKLADLQEADPIYTVDHLEIDFSASFAVGICIGIRPDRSTELLHSNYPKHILYNLHLYRYLLSEFRKQGIGTGIDIKPKMLHLMGIFPKKYENDYLNRFVRPILDEFETKFQLELCTGIGFPPFSIYS